MMLEVAYHIYLVFIAVAVGSSLLRLFRGPTVADRLNAADVMALCCVGLTVGHGWMMGQELWLDIAMVAGLVLFVGTTAVSVFLNPKHLSGKIDE